MIAIDYEYRDSQNKYLTLVCACVKDGDKDPVLYWLHRNPKTQAKLKAYLQQHEGETIISYSCAAEARSFISLGINPLKYKWYDPMLAYRAILSEPHIEISASGMVRCCFEMGIAYKHSEKKDEMRDLILSKTSYTDREKKRILYYCMDDATVLPTLYTRTLQRLAKLYSIDMGLAEKRVMSWSLYHASLAICETVGTPVDVQYVENIIHNHKVAKHFLCEQVNYPFYQYDARKEDYIFKVAVFEDFLKMYGLYDKWPRTPAGQCTTNKDVLKELCFLHDDLTNLATYKRLIDALKSFNPQRSVYKNTIGDDGHSRTGFNPFGSYTGRNQPKSSEFLLLMPNIYRCIEKPEPGWCISSIDWSAQEFALGAVLSGDKNMLEAYASGDPYLHFAKVAGAVPPEAKRKVNKEWDAKRDLFKSTILGLQYGMGVKSLHIKLQRDTGLKLEKHEAETLSKLHHKIFSGYWAWIKSIQTKSKLHVPLVTLDGWVCRPNPDYMTSNCNFLVQGGGASLMRRAMVRACWKGLKIICAHHDALYLYHKEDDKQSIQTLIEVMDQAVSDFFGDKIYIRHEIETHDSSHDWVEARGRKYYDQLSPFFTQQNPEILLKHTFDPVIESNELFNGGKLVI